jgi:hypothetical protein
MECSSKCGKVAKYAKYFLVFLLGFLSSGIITKYLLVKKHHDYMNAKDDYKIVQIISYKLKDKPSKELHDIAAKFFLKDLKDKVEKKSFVANISNDGETYYNIIFWKDSQNYDKFNQSLKDESVFKDYFQYIDKQSIKVVTNNDVVASGLCFKSGYKKKYKKYKKNHDEYDVDNNDHNRDSHKGHDGSHD